MKRKIFLLLMVFIVLTLCGCNTSTTSTSNNLETVTKEADEIIVESSTSHEVQNNVSYISEPTPPKTYCEVSDCYKEGIYEIEGISGNIEHYCSQHYQEMNEIISYMEEEVGAGSASQYLCEQCSKEGTHSIVGLSGMTEYYCTEHYDELLELLELFLE